MLYEFLLDTLSRNRKDALKVVVAIEMLYDLLGVSRDMSYKFFNRDIIKPNVTEITRHTDIEVSYDTNREKRRVVEVVFSVEKKASFQLCLGFDSERLDQVERREDKRALEGDLQALLEHHGVGERKAKELIVTYDEARIRGNIDLLLARAKEGAQLRNEAAYLVKAIEEDYRPKPSPKAQAEAKARTDRARAARAKKQRERLEEDWKRFKEQRLKEHFEVQPDAWKEEKRRLFVEKLEGEGGNSLLRGHYKRQGFGSPMVQGVFFSELRAELLTRPEETDLDEYLEYQKKAVNA